MELKEDEVVMCTVKKIEGTTVFVDIEGNDSGTLVLSEIAAGRIRNLRDYVSINKKIVCKVLKISKDHTELTLRRVTAKERDEAKERYNQEKNLLSMLKTFSSSPKELIEKVKKKYAVLAVLEMARQSPTILEEIFSKSESEKLAKMLIERKDKEKSVKKTIIIKSFSSSGIKDIKDVLTTKEADIRYLGSSQFSVSTKAKDFKEANSLLNSKIDNIEKKAKEKKVFLEIKEK